MIYAYILIEILPEDVIREYKFNDNQSILISGLLDIDNNIDEVYKLFYSINKVIENEGTDKDFKNIHDGFSHFYEKRYNRKMSEDIEILLYLYGSDIQTDEEKSYIREYLDMEEYDEILTYLDQNMKNRQESILHLQKKIAEQYTKSQRKSMMDKMDKEEKINSYGK